jgi:FMN phosphatase YigB (HAD superfamily)
MIDLNGKREISMKAAGRRSPWMWIAAAALWSLGSQAWAPSARRQRVPTGLKMSELPSAPPAQAEMLPRNRGRIVKSSYNIPPQGEAWKEGVFPKDAPKLLTIDPLDVLIQLRSEPGWFYRDVLQEATDYNARLQSPEHYSRAFYRAYEETTRQFPCFGVRDGITSKEWWYHLTRLTYQYADITEPGLRDELLDDGLLDDVFEVLFHDVFMTEEAWEIKPGALEALAALKKWRDEHDLGGDGPLALCALTNFDERMHAILDELDLLEAFDVVLTSREIGAQMPDRSAFQVAMARHGITDPKYCMHVSAEFPTGITGASKAGWHPVYIPITGELDVPPGTDPNLVFSMLGDLFGVLHIWGREPENRLIDTTRPVLENGIFAFHEKIWDDSDVPAQDEESMYLPPADRTKSWEGPGRL